MSRVDQLIAELCPNGVPMYSLGEVTHYSKSRISFEEVDVSTYVSVENLLQNKRGKVDATSIPSEGSAIKYESGDVLIGNIRPYLRKIWLADSWGGTNGDVLVIQIKDRELLIPGFLYYVLSSEGFFLFDIQNSKGAKMPRGSKEAVMTYVIPVPPLPIQEEIVRILDSFAELEAALEAELEARKKQYECYRDALLEFDISLHKSLSEILSIKNGRDYKHLKEGTVPVYGSGGIMTYVDESAYDGPSVLIPRKGSLGNLFYVDEPFWTVDTCFYTKINPEVNPKYVFYCLQKEHLEKLNKAGGVPSLTQSVLNNVKIPVPSILKQDRIVSLLDRFDKLCNDISEGLPAEIEARRKQYEYYRDKLLTFKELDA